MVLVGIDSSDFLELNFRLKVFLHDVQVFLPACLLVQRAWPVVVVVWEQYIKQHCVLDGFELVDVVLLVLDYSIVVLVEHHFLPLVEIVPHMGV